MKRVKAFWNSIWKNDRRLVALCYAVFLAGSILASLYGFAEDAYQRARGNVAQTEISGAQEDIFALTDLEQEGDLYTSTSVDPRMELDLAAVSPTGVPAYVRRVTVRVTFLNMDPGELSVFYKPRADMEEYDATYRVWAHKEAEDGVYTFTLPRGALYGLRLDPGIYSGMQFRLESVIINEPRGFFEWFLPTDGLRSEISGAGRGCAGRKARGRQNLRRPRQAIPRARGRRSSRPSRPLFL